MLMQWLFDHVFMVTEAYSSMTQVSAPTEDYKYMNLIEIEIVT